MRRQIEPSWRTVKSAGLKPHHREWLKEAAAEVAARFPASTMVNVGIYYGASMHCIRAGAPDARLVGVDIKDWGIQNRDELRASYLWEDSTICHVDFDEPIHLLFLDCTMKYEAVLAEILGWCPKVVTDGLIIFNLYHLPPPRWGTRLAADEWLMATASEWEDIEAPRPIRTIRRIK